MGEGQPCSGFECCGLWDSPHGSHCCLSVFYTMIVAKYFSESEFQKCDPPCSLQNMNQGFMNLLDRLRMVAGIPLVLNSAYRSQDYERRKGRSGNGDHPQGKGVDIRCNTSQNRHKILQAAYALGIPRIGVGKTYIHIGIGTGLPQQVTWDYYE